MTTPDKKRLAWLVPLALLLSFWWLFRLNPCVDHELGNRYREWFPSDPAPVAVPADPDAVVIENPYGIEACDYWPTVADHWITLLTLLFITALVGFLAASLEEKPVRRAAWTMLAGITPAVLLSNLVYLPGFLRYVDQEGYGLVLAETGSGVAVILVATGLAALSAWLRLRLRRG